MWSLWGLLCVDVERSLQIIKKTMHFFFFNYAFITKPQLIYDGNCASTGFRLVLI